MNAELAEEAQRAQKMEAGMGRLIFEYTKAHPRQAKVKRGWDNLNSRNFDPQSYVEAGKDIDATDHAGNTVLYWASMAAGEPEGDKFIRTILARKPDVNKCGWTPPAIHLINAPQDILDELDRLGIGWDAQNAGGVTALWAVAVEADLTRVQYLLARGADPNIATIHAAPLHGIAGYGVGEAPVKAVRGCIEALVAAGAELEALDPHGNTPLMLAVQNYAVRARHEPDDWNR